MNLTVARIAAQALLGQRRVLFLVALPVLLVGLATTVRVLAGPGVGTSAITFGIGYILVLPIVALLATTAVIGPEVDDGSIVYLLAKPINRHVVAASKYVVALAATLLLGAAPLLVTGAVLDPDRLQRAFAWSVGGAAAAAAYCAVFLALSAMTRHGVIVGMLYVFFWEGALGGLLTGIKWVSIGAWGQQIAATVSSIGNPREVGTAYALIALGLATVAGLWLAGDRLRSFALHGET